MYRFDYADTEYNSENISLYNYDPMAEEANRLQMEDRQLIALQKQADERESIDKYLQSQYGRRFAY